MTVPNRPAHSLRNRRAQTGFTLMEIMIATVLLAVMMTLLLGAFRVAASTWSKGERKSTQVNRMLIVTNFLRSQISGAVAIKEPPDPMQQNGQPPVIFHGTEQDLRYVGTIPAQVHGGIYQFELYVSNGNSGEGHRDFRAAICPLIKTRDNQPQPPCVSQDNKIDDVAIVEDVETVSIKYFKVPDQLSRSGGPQGPLMQWESDQMPAYIIIAITPQGEAPWPPIMVEPRADAVR